MEEACSSTCSNLAISTVAAPFRRLHGSARQPSPQPIGSLSVLCLYVYGSKAVSLQVGSRRPAADAGEGLKAAELMTEQIRGVGCGTSGWMGGCKDRGMDVK